VNIYLTIYCRRLRPDVQVISRATLDRNFSILHAAGADLVMSHASLAAHTIFNLLQPGKVLMLTEGLNIFQVRAHASLVGKNLVQSGIREETRCSVIAIRTGEELEINPDPMRPIPQDADLILIGTTDGEKRFADRYREKERR
jgi:K+/H+ antiporter YhaU regulatory subunit KhtT